PPSAPPPQPRPPRQPHPPQPHPPDTREEAVAAVAPDRVAEQRRQQPDVPAKGVGHLPLPAAWGGGRAGSHRRYPGNASGFSSVGGFVPSRAANTLSTTRCPIASRVSTVALPRCGITTTFSSASSFGCTSGS